jgi:hypothetical protein
MADVLKEASNAPWEIPGEGQEFLLDLSMAMHTSTEQTTISIYADESAEGGYSFVPVDPDRKQKAARHIAALRGEGFLNFEIAKQSFDQMWPAPGDPQPDKQLTGRMVEGVTELLLSENHKVHPIEAAWVAKQALSVVVESRQLAAERAGI